MQNITESFAYDVPIHFGISKTAIKKMLKRRYEIGKSTPMKFDSLCELTFGKIQNW
jgi:hypothetical protein